MFPPGLLFEFFYLGESGFVAIPGGRLATNEVESGLRFPSIDWKPVDILFFPSTFLQTISQ